jgi:bifunctional DNA-binding transcriptional regulator/antitoxin component of YhaV-PrlF toxin-antitoxin module
MTESRVGSKGELFPPKEIREKLGLHPHMRVIYRIQDGTLLVEPIKSLQDILKEPPTMEITLEEFHSFRKDLSKKVES